MLIRYVAVDRWLLALAAGWKLPWIVQTERSGWSVLMERAEPWPA